MDRRIRDRTIALLAPLGAGLRGTLTNHGTVTLTSVSASYFALDSGGRPYDFDFAQTDSQLAPGASWAFSFADESTIGKYLAFAGYATDAP